MKTSYYVLPVWDDEAQVWVTDSDILGLHVEAETLERFFEEVDLFARDLIVENHLSDDAVGDRPLAQVIPAIRYHAPRGT